jgi:uncharacterized protein
MDKLRDSIELHLKDVKINDTFWSKYETLVREVMLPYQWDALNDKVEGAEAPR